MARVRNYSEPGIEAKWRNFSASMMRRYPWTEPMSLYR